MSENQFSLIALIKELFRRIKFILIFSFCALIVGLIFGLLQKDTYTSKSVFIVKSPMGMDRNHIFKRDNYQNSEFFASENENDHIQTIANSSTLLDYIAQQYVILNANTKKSKEKLVKEFESKMKIKRNSNRSFELSVTDKDPKIATTIAIDATNKIEAMYKEYFLQSQRSMAEMLQDRIKRVDAELTPVEDSILAIRNSYGIYQEMLPERGKNTISQVTNVSAKKAEGMELLQKFTAQKDQLIEDRAGYISLVNEYNFDTNTDYIKLFYRVVVPYPEEKPSWPNFPIILAVSFLGGFLFSCFLVLLQYNFKKHPELT